MSEDQRSDTQLYRVGAWMGIAFAVLFVAGTIAFPTPDNNEDIASWEKWWTDSGHRTAAVIATYLMVFGLLAFVWFMWSLHRRFRDSGPMLIFGSLFVASDLVSALVKATIPGGKIFGSNPVPAGEFSREINNIGGGLFVVAGALTGGAFIAIAAYYARRHGVLPRWLTTAGYVTAALQLLGAFFIPIALFVLWILISSIVLLRRIGHTTSPAAVSD